jgi:hypothetical protein|uniref:Uncharacterized protein n=1 Tax=Rhodopseudomonas palustris (strain BisA53) TaxID=316055 RepID=Q07TB8_RHOP5
MEVAMSEGGSSAETTAANSAATRIATLAPAATGSPPPPPDPAKRVGWVRRGLREINPLRVIGGVVLALLVFLAAASAVMFFAAAQLQSRISDLNLNGVPLTIWRVAAFGDEFANSAAEIQKLRSQIEIDQRNLAGDKNRYLVMSADQKDAADRIVEDALALRQKIESATQVTRPPVAPDAAETITSIELLLANDDLRARFGDELAAIKKRYAENRDLRALIKTEEAKALGFQTWIDSEIEQRKARVDAAARLFGETNAAVAPEIVDRIRNITAELTALKTILYGSIYSVALWTNDTLVLLLLISMGVLGAALNLLALFFTNDDNSLSFGEYPLRLAFGAVLAIVMFIVAKAGVPILADTTKIGGGNAPLNPYFISLLAVISGLMSDRAMGTIQNVAATVLKSIGGTDFSQRYGRVVLDDALKAANRDIEGLARLLEIDADATKKLLSGTEAISPDRQKLISAYLGQRPRDLFSDLPAG